jgi:transcriptional regulator with PAS, ATPase and Fis domain
MVDKGDFRQDLFFRLHVYPIFVPPLRKRDRDIILLANTFLQTFSREQKKNLETLHPSIIEYLKNQEWKGNIRELQNCIERLVTLAAPDETVLKPDIIPLDLQQEMKQYMPHKPVTQNKSLKEHLRECETSVIRQALEDHNWNQSAAARSLDISEAIMRYRMKKLSISRKH